jgi:methionyl-tRNA synthetase
MQDKATLMEPKPLIKYEDFAKIDLRVAKVLAARAHPNADKLLLLQIQVGDVEKQIVAGIRAHYQPEDLVGRNIVIVNNLEPAVLRGEESNGMLLAATDSSGVMLLRLDRDCESGAAIK